MNSPIDAKLEEKCYELQARINVIRYVAMTFLGKKKVKKLEKNLQHQVEKEISNLKQYPLNL